MGAPKKQFQRPSIDLTPSEEKREWKNVAAVQLGEGDLVPGWGLVTQVADHPGGVVIIWKNGTRSVLEENDQFFAFTKV